jgi:hypothetical protein
MPSFWDILPANYWAATQETLLPSPDPMDALKKLSAQRTNKPDAMSMAFELAGGPMLAPGVKGAKRLGMGNKPTTPAPAPAAEAKKKSEVGIRAYHGSPHDFDKFDLSKIGTGEGAQAYGHGLYFAENPKVAQEYKGMTLSPRARMIFDDAGGDLVKAKALAVERGFGKGWVMDDLDRLAQSPGPGRMYEVNINAHPDQFLDWDKPLSGQGAPLQRALAPALENFRKDPTKTLGGEFVLSEGKWVPTEQMPGSFWLRNAADNPVTASESLREAGIPGIKYLDQGSRQPRVLLDGQPIPKDNWGAMEAKEALELYGSPEAAIKALRGRSIDYRGMGAEAAKLLESGAIKAHQPAGTNNYVVFDDKLIDILKKYGIAGMGMIGMGGAASQQSPVLGMDN